jgi:hypothetical protein
VPDGNTGITPDPYISLVVTARNDDHGGNLLGRMQIFLDGWIEQARRYEIPSELIVVEWNPPPDRPQLTTALRWPKNFGQCAVRIIEVPPELHHRYAHFEALPLYQMIAKNVGIRRSRGKFVLATNIDILFSNEMAAFLSSQKLNANCMYRIDRFDVMSDVPMDAPLDEQLDYCRTHLIRINRREGTFPVSADGSPLLSQSDVAARDSGILFGPGWLPLESSGKVRFRWAQDRPELLLGSPPPPPSSLVLDIEPGPPPGVPLDLEIATGESRLLGRVHLDGRSELRVPLPVPVPDRLLLRVLGERVPANGDPRGLCLRVFRVQYELRSEVEAPLNPSVKPARRVRSASWWEALQHLIHRLATGGPNVQLTVPVSRRLSRLLSIYVESGGFTGMMRGGFRLPPKEAANNAQPASTNVPAGPQRKDVDSLHTNACGDFTLLARERWLDLRGYPEFDIFSMNLDSVFCFAAHYGGVREEMLLEPMRIYHVEHGSGSGWTPEGQGKLFERIAAKGLSFISYEEVFAWAAQMSRLRSPMIFNRENWGLNDFRLKETVLPMPGDSLMRSPI